MSSIRFDLFVVLWHMRCGKILIALRAKGESHEVESGYALMREAFSIMPFVVLHLEGSIVSRGGKCHYLVVSVLYFFFPPPCMTISATSGVPTGRPRLYYPGHPNVCIVTFSLAPLVVVPCFLYCLSESLF